MAVTLGGLGDRRFSIPDRFGRLFDRRVLLRRLELRVDGAVCTLAIVVEFLTHSPKEASCGART
jgi:hypothetical protein